MHAESCRALKEFPSLHFSVFPFRQIPTRSRLSKRLKMAHASKKLRKTDATAVIFANLHRKRQHSSLNAVCKNVLKRDDPCTLNLITAIKTKPLEKNHNKKNSFVLTGRNCGRMDLTSTNPRAPCVTPLRNAAVCPSEISVRLHQICGPSHSTE